MEALRRSVGDGELHEPVEVQRERAAPEESNVYKAREAPEVVEFISDACLYGPFDEVLQMFALLYLHMPGMIQLRVDH